MLQRAEHRGPVAGADASSESSHDNPVPSPTPRSASPVHLGSSAVACSYLGVILPPSIPATTLLLTNASHVQTSRLTNLKHCNFDLVPICMIGSNVDRVDMTCPSDACQNVTTVLCNNMTYQQLLELRSIIRNILQMSIVHVRWVIERPLEFPSNVKRR